MVDNITWEELKEKAKELGYELGYDDGETITGISCDYDSTEWLEKEDVNLIFCSDGDVLEKEFSGVISSHRTYEQMYAIMEALK